MSVLKLIEPVPTEIKVKIQNAIENHGICIGDVCGDIIKKVVIGYAVIQIINENSTKSIMTKPIFENTYDNYCDFDYNINIPENATVISILPETGGKYAAFGGVPNDITTAEDFYKTKQNFDEYVFLGIESCDDDYDEMVWKDKLTKIWFDKLYENSLYY